MDVTTMRSILRAFYSVFPEGFTMADAYTGDFLMFGSDHPLRFLPDRINPRFNEPINKQALSYFNLQRPEDLLWYFSLSRQQVLAIVGDSEPNTDLNILSEVRLSALDQNATGNENPYNMLKANYSLDANRLLGQNAADIYYTYAQSLLNWREYNLVHFAVNNLAKFDPDRARAVTFDYYYRTYNYQAAVALFRSYDIWPDITRQRYSDLMMQNQQFKDANNAINRIQDEALRRAEMAKWLYLQRQFNKLAKLKAISNTERMWQLTGLAQTNLIKAGKALSLLSGKVNFSESQLRVLIHYTSTTNQISERNRYTRLLIATLDQQAENLKLALDLAIGKKEVVRARSLLTQIESLNPGIEGIAELRDKVVALEKTNPTSRHHKANAMSDRE